MGHNITQEDRCWQSDTDNGTQDHSKTADGQSGTDMGHNITVRQLLDRVVQIWDTTSQSDHCWAEWYRYGTQHHSKTTVGQSGTDMGHNITVRQLLDRVAQIWDTTS